MMKRTRIKPLGCRECKGFLVKIKMEGGGVKRMCNSCGAWHGARDASINDFG